MSKTAKEGTVAFMILAGLGLFVGLFAWVQGMAFGQKSYRVTVQFEDAKGMQEGTPLRYRGVEIGRALKIEPSSEQVTVAIEITATELRIPGDSVVEIQSGAFLGEKYMDIAVQSPLVNDPTLPRPVDPECNPDVIICDGSHLQGRVLPDLADLIRVSYQLSEIFTDPLLMATLENLGEGLLSGTSGLSGLGTNVSSLASSLNTQVDNLGNTLTSVGNAANRIGDTAGTIQSSAREIQATAVTARDILEVNRTVLALTLANFGTASTDLVTLMKTVNPVVREVGEGEMFANLGVMSENLRQASARLAVAAGAISDEETLNALQQTLDSARMTFQNAQKITTDLEDLSGDAKLRGDIRRLLGGLGGLFGRAQQVEQQIQAAQQVLVANGQRPFALKDLGTTDWQSWERTVADLNDRLDVLDRLEVAETLPTATPTPEAGVE